MFLTGSRGHLREEEDGGDVGVSQVVWGEDGREDRGSGRVGEEKYKWKSRDGLTW